MASKPEDFPAFMGQDGGPKAALMLCDLLRDLLSDTRPPASVVIGPLTTNLLGVSHFTVYSPNFRIMVTVTGETKSLPFDREALKRQASELRKMATGLENKLNRTAEAWEQGSIWGNDFFSLPYEMEQLHKLVKEMNADWDAARAKLLKDVRAEKANGS